MRGLFVVLRLVQIQLVTQLVSRQIRFCGGVAERFLQGLRNAVLGRSVKVDFDALSAYAVRNINFLFIRQHKGVCFFGGILVLQSVNILVNRFFVSVCFGNIVNGRCGEALLAVFVKHGISLIVCFGRDNLNAFRALVQLKALTFPERFSRRLFRFGHFTLNNAVVVFAVRGDLYAFIPHIRKNIIIGFGTQIRADFRAFQFLNPCADFRHSFRFGNVGGYLTMFRDLIVHFLVIFLDDCHLFRVFGGINASDFPVFTAHKLALNAVFLKRGFHSSRIVFPNGKALDRLRRTVDTLLHNLAENLLHNRLVAVEKLYRLFFAVPDNRNGNFVLLCFFGYSLRVPRQKV